MLGWLFWLWGLKIVLGACSKVTQQKARMIGSVPELSAVVQSAAADPQMDLEKGHILSDAYCLLPADLRDLENFQRVLTSAGFDYRWVASKCRCP